MEAPDKHLSDGQDSDAKLAELMERAALSLQRAGVTVQDLLDALPDARTKILNEAYGSEYMREIERQFAAYHQ